jgi:hypothetical protein
MTTTDQTRRQTAICSSSIDCHILHVRNLDDLESVRRRAPVEHTPDARPRTPLNAACARMSGSEYATASHASDVDVRAVPSRTSVMAVRFVLGAPPALRVVRFHICCTRGAAIVEAHAVLPKCAPFILPRTDGLAAITERGTRKRRRRRGARG